MLKVTIAVILLAQVAEAVLLGDRVSFQYKNRGVFGEVVGITRDAPNGTNMLYRICRDADYTIGCSHELKLTKEEMQGSTPRARGPMMQKSMDDIMNHVSRSREMVGDIEHFSVGSNWQENIPLSEEEKDDLKRY